MAPASSKDAVTAGKRPTALRASTTPISGSLSDRNRKDTTNTKANNTDSFDSTQNDDDDDVPEPPRASVEMDDLPIELIGLIDSFIDSLQAKVLPAPLTIEALAQKFQDFYATASSHIATHIAALAMRQNRERELAATTTPNTTPRSAANLLRAKAASISGRDRKTPPPSATTTSSTEPEQQMITSEELARRKQNRRALELKKSLLEEAVERRLCEGIYQRIYQHRSTQDEAQDDKLRSKTAALDLVGIGPTDLGINLGKHYAPVGASAEVLAAKQAEVRASLEPARRALEAMSETHYPLGKLNRLKAAHKGIVDTLAHFHPSSSADEIMPMLIYTLITLPPEKLHVVSDLQFIQRFRWEAKMEGESAYCLTNLEAAISFLDTVDLSTLRADEGPSGRLTGEAEKGEKAEKAEKGEKKEEKDEKDDKTEKNNTTEKEQNDKTETFPPYFDVTPQVETTEATATGTTATTTATATGSGKPPSPASGLRAAVQLRNRRLSDLVNTPAQALGAASGAVLNTFNAADQGLKTIGNSLEGSYRLFFGKAGQGGGGVGNDGTTSAAAAVLPKTLDEARKLVEPTDDLTLTSTSLLPALTTTTTTTTTTPPSTATTTTTTPLSTTNRFRKSVSREHSADSTRSGASSVARRVTFEDDAASTTSSTTQSQTQPNPNSNQTNPALLESVRSFGNSLNPISRLGFRGFGRQERDKEEKEGGDLATAFPDLAGALPPKAHIAPPVKRFMELHNPADLRIGEVLELLRDYRRLATALKDMGAFA